jgi:hypothetical protein
MGLNDFYKEYQKLYSDVKQQYQDIKREPSQHLLKLSTYLADITKQGVDDASKMWSSVNSSLRSPGSGPSQQAHDGKFRPQTYRSPTAKLMVTCNFSSFSLPLPWE